MRTKALLIFAAGLVGVALAQSTCNQAAGKQTTSGLAVYAPDTTTSPTKGQDFQIKWEPTSGYSTVSILLLKGPSTNVVPYSCIANSIPNSGSYTWSVPSSGLDAQSSGYGIQIIADGSGDFQYSTQFGISDGSSSSSSAASGSVVAITSTTLMSGEKVTQTIFHTDSSSSSSVAPSSSSSSISAYPTASSSYKIVKTSYSKNRTSKAYPTAYYSNTAVSVFPSATSGAANVTESVTPTISMSVPSSLANVGGSGQAITSSAAAGTAAGPASAPAPSTSVKAALAPRAIAVGGGSVVAGVGAVVAALVL